MIRLTFATDAPTPTCDAYPPPLTCLTTPTSRRCTPCADAADDAEFERLHKREQEARTGL